MTVSLPSSTACRRSSRSYLEKGRDPPTSRTPLPAEPTQTVLAGQVMRGADVTARVRQQAVPPAGWGTVPAGARPSQPSALIQHRPQHSPLIALTKATPSGPVRPATPGMRSALPRVLYPQVSYRRARSRLEEAAFAATRIRGQRASARGQHRLCPVQPTACPPTPSPICVQTCAPRRPAPARRSPSCPSVRR